MYNLINFKKACDGARPVGLCQGLKEFSIDERLMQVILELYEKASSGSISQLREG
ncbi:hypothetical protein DPMN_016215 [Dreissena polymorpha]|uniref:Uncharacterized protein n=1 Tax=Dreissena polymorpha TaxID=45954 RepID=A0A9D4NCQ6_DREPO|nr:hypothetical protein DPMN_016215 [Dreissena polymorpha]